MEYVPNKIQGWMNDQELEWLFERGKEYNTIVEVGAWKGRSTHALLSGCRNGIVIAVDHFLGSEDERKGNHHEATTKDIKSIFLENMKEFKNLILVPLDSVEAAKLFSKVEMVFIDACHLEREVIKDIDAWLPKCTKLISGHDYQYPSVKKAISHCNLSVESVHNIWYSRL